MNIGKLREVDIRNLWKNEERDFSVWLAKEENIEYLNDILGLNLTDIRREEHVGSFECDIFAKDETSNTNVIIENQLEASNHDHLGKIITYASGLNANVVVWIVKKAREEHRSAIEWLNNNTNGNMNFFLIELHAYKIGDSLPAPYFEVVEKPNDFIKNTKVNGNKSEMNKSQSERVEFWSQLNETLIEKGKPFNVRKATTDHWYDVAIGNSSAHVSIVLVNKESHIVVELYIANDKEMFDRLYEQRNVIEEQLGFKLDWQRLDDRQVSRIKYYIKGLNFDDHSNYDELIDKTINTAVKMRDVFKKYV
jgi:hypothetical protein